MISSENLAEAYPEVPPTPWAFFSSTSAMSSDVDTFEDNMTALGNYSWSLEQVEAANTSSIDNFYFYEVNAFCILLCNVDMILFTLVNICLYLFCGSYAWMVFFTIETLLFF